LAELRNEAAAEALEEVARQLEEKGLEHWKRNRSYADGLKHAASLCNQHAAFLREALRP
jgi:hypothetical protein